MGSTFVNTKTRFSIPYILHENKIFDQRGGVFMEPLKNFTVHFDSKKRIRKIHSEKDYTVEKGSCFKIRMKVRFNEEIQEPIMAYTFKNIQGTEITGTNTMYENAKIEHSGKGDICTVTFTQNMNLQGGEYLLSFGCTGYKNGDFTVFHRLYDACNITVISSKNTVGFYDMDSKVEVRCEEQV